MNPSTAELLAAAEGLGQEEVILLPNNPNVILAAERAAEEARANVVVVPTRSIQAGLSALVAFDSARTADENAEAMADAAAAVRSGAVTRASRTTTIGGLDVEEGQFLGLVDGEAVTAGAVLETVARDVLERLLTDTSDVLTILLGEEAPDAAALRSELEDAHPELEIEVHDGGQPHYPLLFAAE
jgi:uncharacterized protein